MKRAWRNSKPSYRPLIGLAIISLLLCGLLFPLVVTGIAQVVFPYQANGELVQLDGHAVGSELIAQMFTSPMFFHPRAANESASGVDPDITLQDALSQVLNVSAATGISVADLNATVRAQAQGTFWIFGSPYVDVLDLNLALINGHQSVYSNFTA
jgi:K+-transporting ATPase ATPase C chain